MTHFTSTTAKTLIAAALALTGASAAFAQEAMQDSPSQYPATLSRVEVRQVTLPSARVEVVQYGEATQFALPTGAEFSRAQARAETLEAMRLGAIGLHERNEFPTVAQLESIRQAGLKAVPMTMAAR
jgi:hypothetical protein